MIMVPGPEGKRDSRPEVDGAKFPPSHWRTVPTHPLDPQYTYDPVGQLCRYKTALDVEEAKSPAAIAARKQANGDGPQGELVRCCFPSLSCLSRLLSLEPELHPHPVSHTLTLSSSTHRGKTRGTT
jgi:hypothetical protein